MSSYERVFSLREWDYRITRSFVVLGVLSVAIWNILMPLIMWARDMPINATFHLADNHSVVPDIASAKPGVSMTWAGPVTAHFEHFNATSWLAYLAPEVIMTGIVAAIAWLTLRILRTIQHAEPFTAANCTRFHAIGAILIFGAPIYSFARSLRDMAMVDAAVSDIERFDFVISLDFLAVMGIGFVIMAISQAFRQGTALKDEVEGLV